MMRKNNTEMGKLITGDNWRQDVKLMYQIMSLQPVIYVYESLLDTSENGVNVTNELITATQLRLASGIKRTQPRANVSNVPNYNLNNNALVSSFQLASNFEGLKKPADVFQWGPKNSSWNVTISPTAAGTEAPQQDSTTSEHMLEPEREAVVPCTNGYVSTVMHVSIPKTRIRRMPEALPVTREEGDITQFCAETLTSGTQTRTRTQAHARSWTITTG